MLPESREERGCCCSARSARTSLFPTCVRSPSTGGSAPPGGARTPQRADRKLDVRANDAGARLATLSGGNQQKVLLAKWLFRPPRVLIADEPTRGVDIGAKHAIYELVDSFAREGMASCSSRPR